MLSWYWPGPQWSIMLTFQQNPGNLSGSDDYDPLSPNSHSLCSHETPPSSYEQAPSYKLFTKPGARQVLPENLPCAKAWKWKNEWNFIFILKALTESRGWVQCGSRCAGCRWAEPAECRKPQAGCGQAGPGKTLGSTTSEQSLKEWAKCRQVTGKEERGMRDRAEHKERGIIV